jgi:hypothetical protein
MQLAKRDLEMELFVIALISLALLFGFIKTREVKRIREERDHFLKELWSLKENSKTIDSIEKEKKILEEQRERLKSVVKEEHEKSKQELLAESRIIEQKSRSIENISIENTALKEVIEQLANLWINDSFKYICAQTKYNNHSQQEARLQKTFEKCRNLGISFDGRQEQGFYIRLKNIWLKQCEEQKAKEEQERIKEIMREEQRAEKMRTAELKKIEEEEKKIREKQIENVEKMKHLKEIEALRTLTEAQRLELEEIQKENQTLSEELAEKERAKSMAELTKAGHIYVISNIGSFGENVFKVGMTRRLIPEDRVDELGDASVPFPFDIHMMLSTVDAPSLERKIHEELMDYKVNFVNERKEFFNVSLSIIKDIIDKNASGTKYHFEETPKAIQWRESNLIRDKKAYTKKDAA